MRFGTGSAARTGQRRRQAQRHTTLKRGGAEYRERRGGAVTVGGYLNHHWQCIGHSLGYITRTPLASLMTLAIIGISLALPAGMYVLLKNVQHVSAGWNSSVQISLFLKQDVGGDGAQRLLHKLQDTPGIDAVEYISPDQALREFRRSSGFGNALNSLTSNPLPAVMVVHPSAEQSHPGAIQSLLRRLRAFPEVDLANLDMQWVERLYTVMDIVKRGVLIVAGLLGVGVLLIVGNTIRLAIHNRREEIEVKKLIGATNAFIRRPFLYYGCWYGVLGGVAACGLVNLSLWSLQGPVQQLSLLYGGGIRLEVLGIGAGMAVVGFATLLGYLGAWLAVGRHLSAIEPV
jgi:cell division transport system permease protein